MGASFAAMPACIVLTRPAQRNVALQEALHDAACGAPLNLLALPALETRTRDLPDQTVPDLCALAAYDLVVLVSRQAAQVLVDAVAPHAQASAWPAQTWLATVGAASAQPLLACTAIPARRVLHPPAAALHQDSEALWALLAPRLAHMKRALILRGPTGREWLGERLEAAGLVVDRRSVYDREPARWTAAQVAPLRRALASTAPVVFLLTSSESVNAVWANLRAFGLDGRWSDCRFVVIHQRIAAHLQTILGYPDVRAARDIVVCAPTVQAMAAALMAQAACPAVPLGLQSRHD